MDQPTMVDSHVEGILVTESGEEVSSFENPSTSVIVQQPFTENMWKLNPGVRTIALTKIANQTCKLHIKETEYGAEH